MAAKDTEGQVGAPTLGPFLLVPQGAINAPRAKEA